MGSKQIVFLFDITALDNCIDSSQRMLNKTLSSLRIVCLRLLCEFANRTDNLRWGFKFFSLSGDLSQSMDKYPLSDVNLEAFENLESELCLRYERYISYRKALSKQCIEDNSCAVSPSKIINLALTQVLCDYQWDVPEICSPVRGCSTMKKQSAVDDIKKNFVFLFSTLPSNFEDLRNYFGLQSTVSSHKIRHILMPAALYDKFVSNSHISLVWLNTAEMTSYMVSEESIETHQILDGALRSFTGALIPFQALSQPYHAEESFMHSELKSLKENIANEKENSLPSRSGCDGSRSFNKHWLMLPFSSVFSYYISNRHLTNEFYEGTLCLLKRKLNMKLFLTVNSLLRNSSTAEKSVPMQQLKRKRTSSGTSGNVQSNISSVWSTFTVLSTAPFSFYTWPSATVVCLADRLQKSSQDCFLFSELMKTLYFKKQCLALRCETKDGFGTFGLLSPVSPSTGIISVFDSLYPSLQNENVSFLLKTLEKTEESSKNDCRNKNEEDSLESLIKYFRAPEQSIDQKNTVTASSFEMSCTEKWFVPSPRVTEIAQEINEKRLKKENPAQSAFYEKLRCHYQTKILSTEKRTCGSAKKLTNFADSALIRRSPRLKKFQNTNLNISRRSASLVEQSACQSSQLKMQQNLSSGSQIAGTSLRTARTNSNTSSLEFEDEEKLLEYLQGVYDLAVESGRDTLSSVRNIVDTALLFFKSKVSTDVTEKVHRFMQSHMCLSVKRINEKYENCADSATLAKKIREYQIQVVLILEVESVSPLSAATCIKMATALLRSMSFSSGPTVLNQFLHDTVFENYSHNLHDILVEIGDELNIPIIPDILSPSSSISESPVRSSTVSVRSSSSMSSQQDHRSLKRSSSNTSFSGNISKRQILIPKLVSHQRAQKLHNEVKVVRQSPRLAVKRKHDTTKNSGSTSKNVCRNLFNSHKTPTKQRKSVVNNDKERKRRVTVTPSGLQKLKKSTLYAPETPSPKQGLSAARRKQLHVRHQSEPVTVIAESPNFCKVKNISVKESNLQGLKRNCSFYASASTDVLENSIDEHKEIIVEFSEKNTFGISDFEFSKSPAKKTIIKSCSKRLFANNLLPEPRSTSTAKRNKCSLPLVTNSKSPIKHIQSLRSESFDKLLSSPEFHNINSPKLALTPEIKEKLSGTSVSPEKDKFVQRTKLTPNQKRSIRLTGLSSPSSELTLTPVMKEKLIDTTLISPEKNYNFIRQSKSTPCRKRVDNLNDLPSSSSELAVTPVMNGKINSITSISPEKNGTTMQEIKSTPGRRTVKLIGLSSPSSELAKTPVTKEKINDTLISPEKHYESFTQGTQSTPSRKKKDKYANYMGSSKDKSLCLLNHVLKKGENIQLRSSSKAHNTLTEEEFKQNSKERKRKYLPEEVDTNSTFPNLKSTPKKIPKKISFHLETESNNRKKSESVIDDTLKSVSSCSLTHQSKKRSINVYKTGNKNINLNETPIKIEAASHITPKHSLRTTTGHNELPNIMLNCFVSLENLQYNQSKNEKHSRCGQLMKRRNSSEKSQITTRSKSISSSESSFDTIESNIRVSFPEADDENMKVSNSTDVRYKNDRITQPGDKAASQTPETRLRKRHCKTYTSPTPLSLFQLTNSPVILSKKVSRRRDSTKN